MYTADLLSTVHSQRRREQGQDARDKHIEAARAEGGRRGVRTCGGTASAPDLTTLRPCASHGTRLQILLFVIILFREITSCDGNAA